MIALNIELEDEGTDGIPDAYNYNGIFIPFQAKKKCRKESNLTTATSQGPFLTEYGILQPPITVTTTARRSHNPNQKSVILIIISE